MAGLIVVTGASTGIGRAVAQRMAGKGFDVLAGVRNDSDAEAIRGERIEPVIVDVTVPENWDAEKRNEFARQLAAVRAKLQE